MAVEYQEDITDNRHVDVIDDKADSVDMNGEEIGKDALQNTQRETSMEFFDAIRKYYKAMLWSAFLSLTLIMQGFDHSYITAFYGFPSFQRHYGFKQADGSYAIPAKWQTAISDGVICTEIVALLFVGRFTKLVGYRWAMIISLIAMIGFIFIQFFSSSLPVYLVAELLLGFPWGVFQTITTTYAAEVCPVALRAYLTMFVSLCWTLGYLIGNCTMRGLLHYSKDSTKPYKIAFALQWMWPLPIAIGCYFAPESPWLMVRKGKREEAFKSARRLATKKLVTDKEVEEQIAMMIHTDELEKEAAAENNERLGSYWELFKGVNLRRTEIVVITYCIQNITNPIGYYGVVFMEQAGMSTNKSFDFSIGGSAISIFAVFVAWFLMERGASRRIVFLFGVSYSCVNALVIGFLGIPTSTSGILYGIASLLLVESFVSFMGVTTNTYPIVSELPANALRAESVGLARAVYNVVGIINGILVPRMISHNADEWGWGPKCEFYFAFWLLVAFAWAYFRLPDGTNKTYAEIDILFKNKVPARKFKSTEVDLLTGTLVANSTSSKVDENDRVSEIADVA